MHDLPHAFGGALALAWCTRRARGTLDIEAVSGVFVNYLGGDDDRIARLRSLAR